MAGRLLPFQAGHATALAAGGSAGWFCAHGSVACTSVNYSVVLWATVKRRGDRHPFDSDSVPPRGQWFHELIECVFHSLLAWGALWRGLHAVLLLGESTIGGWATPL